MNQRYELLNEGDLIKEGDEYFEDREWHSYRHGVGNKISDIHRPSRRPIPNKPKVRLEELIRVIYQNCILGSDQVEIVAKAVCAKLNIELEEPKPEWEAAFESFPQVKVKGMENCAVGGCFVSKVDFKAVWEAAMFEAGQKSKEWK